MISEKGRRINYGSITGMPKVQSKALSRFLGDGNRRWDHKEGEEAEGELPFLRIQSQEGVGEGLLD